jgi:acyl-CoA synthetase (AMP-forming)/AMP-acid ligase II
MFETTLTRTRIGTYIDRGEWTDRTLFDDVRLHAGRTPSRPALVDPSGSYTYAELLEESKRVGLALLDVGVRHGDVVAVQLPNWKEFVATILGVEQIGAVAMPLAPSLRSRELEQIFSLSRPAVIMVPGAFHGFDHSELALSLREALGHPRTIVGVGGGLAAGVESWGDFCARAERVQAPADILGYLAPKAADIAELAFTSGTTGEPKGAMHTHGSAVAAVVSTVERQSLGPEDVFHVGATVGHNAGYFYGVRVALHAGGLIVLQDKWDPDSMIELVRRHRVTYSFGAPTHLVDLLGSVGATPESLETLRVYICAGAPVPVALAEAALEVMPKALCRVFGMTEIGHATSTVRGDPRPKLVGTDGSPQPGIRIRITDDCRGPLPSGQEGQIEVSGPFLFAGYVQGREFTSQWYDGQWFQTGDLGVVDGEGFLRVTGRTKDIIVRGGENVPVREIEEILSSHDGIAEVAVVGAADVRLGEQAVACVRLKSAVGSLSLEDLQTLLEERQVTRQYWPERLVLVDNFPRTPSGKIKKGELREMVSDLALAR